jgi:hypothetical protein
VLGAVLFAQASAGGGIVPDLSSVTDGWSSVRGAAVEVRFPQALASEAEPLAHALDAFAAGLQSKLDAPSRPIVVDVFPTHAALERATREQIPVEVTGSIRGRDLLYLEMPGRSAAVPRPRALEDAARYVALLVLAPLAGDSPRWFVEGIAHAEAVPYSPTIDRRYLETLQEHGIPTFDALANPGLFRTPEGPLLARALVDHLAAHHGGREVIDGILRDAIGGKPFRDALYERARLTLTALETSWQDSVRAILAEAASGESR